MSLFLRPSLRSPLGVLTLCALCAGVVGCSSAKKLAGLQKGATIDPATGGRLELLDPDEASTRKLPPDNSRPVTTL